MPTDVRRVVITGIGAVSGLGDGAAIQYEKARAGQSGLSLLPADLATQLDTRVAGQVASFRTTELDRNDLAMFDRVAHLSWAAASEALEMSGLRRDAPQPAERCGVFWGVGLGGPATLEKGYRDLFVDGRARVRPFSIIGIMTNGSTALLSMKSGFRGPSLTYSSACASSAHAIGEAFRQIRHGYCDAALAGGGETPLTFGSIKAWEALQTLARTDADHPERSCRPFSRERTGFILGEASAALVLESLDSATRRGAKILAELVGFGTSSDAQHITKPSTDGQVSAMRGALADAGIRPDQVAYLNAHGTATKVGDSVEVASIREAFGAASDKLAVSSTKAVHGHTLGAAGALELLITIQAQAQGMAPPTAFLDDPDPECDIDCVPNIARPLDIEFALSNSFAFGGSNASLLTRRWDA